MARQSHPKGSDLSHALLPAFLVNAETLSVQCIAAIDQFPTSIVERALFGIGLRTID